jgi:hypothetical protein
MRFLVVGGADPARNDPGRPDRYEPEVQVDVSKQIAPASKDAGLACLRGGRIARVGDLTRNVWGGLLNAGVAVPKVSVPNPD